MPPTSGAAGSRAIRGRKGDMEVNALTLTALLLLVAALCAASVTRRRAARRAEEERARARARRRRVPVVSANVRGLPSGVTDLWAEETDAPQSKNRVAP